MKSTKIHNNRPFPSPLVPLFQSESKCKTILMKMTLICMEMKGFALRLVLKQRYKKTRKWPICISEPKKCAFKKGLETSQNVGYLFLQFFDFVALPAKKKKNLRF